MWDFFKGVFGSNDNDTISTAPKKKHTRKNVSAKQYYKNNGRFYDREDDSIVEDAMLLVILMDMFDEEQIDDSNSTTTPEVVEEPIKDILDMDVNGIEILDSDYTLEQVEETISMVDAPEQVEMHETYTPPAQESYSAPEPVRESAGSSYSHGSSDSSDSSSYDSGSSSCDSGGGCD